jgi:hypothetical protein
MMMNWKETAIASLKKTNRRNITNKGMEESKRKMLVWRGRIIVKKSGRRMSSSVRLHHQAGSKGWRLMRRAAAAGTIFMQEPTMIIIEATF